MISRDEWLAALDAASRREADPHALTLKEIVDQFGVCRERATTLVRQMVAAGTATKTIKWVQTDAGPRKAPAYRLTPRETPPHA
jgi:hypothetical protein